MLKLLFLTSWGEAESMLPRNTPFSCSLIRRSPLIVRVSLLFEVYSWSWLLDLDRLFVPPQRKYRRTML